MQSSADVLKPDQATTERIKLLLPFGLAERQARFLASVMFHSGVFVRRQYGAFAGLTHGQNTTNRSTQPSASRTTASKRAIGAPNAHLYETGRMRRTHLRGHANILKRLFIHIGGFNWGS